MQDEINEKVVALSVKGAKLTAETLQKAIKTMLAQAKKQQEILTGCAHPLPPGSKKEPEGRTPRRSPARSGAIKTMRNDKGGSPCTKKTTI